MFQRIRNYINVIFERDPAARSVREILLCYPGVHAMRVHPLAHWMWLRNMRVLARFVSHVSRALTGIEIHPGATIGEGFFIDHGMGVVIGETSEIGKNVTLYHGVTVGGTSWNKGKRQTTLEDNVIEGEGVGIVGGIGVGHEGKVAEGQAGKREMSTKRTVGGDQWGVGYSEMPDL